MKKILITGATGFVGRNVAEFLKNYPEKYTIYTPNSKELDCLDAAKVRQYLEEHKFKIVLHLAVYGDGIDKTKDGTKALENNLRMFMNFYNCSMLYGRMIYTGSGAEFDKRESIVNVQEDEINKRIPIDQYGLMKYIVNRLIETSDNIYNLRLFGIYGKYEYWQTKFISNVCCKAITDIPLSIRQNVYFDYLWIEDFARMLEQFMNIEKPMYHSYNAVNGTKIDLRTICEIVNEVAGKKLPILVCKEGIGNEYTASNERILKELNDFQYTSQKKAIGILYKWYEQHQDNINLMGLLY